MPCVGWVCVNVCVVPVVCDAVTKSFLLFDIILFEAGTNSDLLLEKIKFTSSLLLYPRGAWQSSSPSPS